MTKGGQYNVVSNSSFQDNLYAAVSVTNGSEPYGIHASLENLIVKNNGRGLYINLSGTNMISEYVSIDNCQIVGNGRGIQFNVQDGLDSLAITNCVIGANSYFGILGEDMGGDYVQIRLEGNVVVGNGYEPNSYYWYDGVKIVASNTRFVNNTIAYNNRYGYWCWMNDPLYSSTANNIFYRNGNYGIYKQYLEDVVPPITTNVFWQNDGDDELKFNTPGGLLYSVEEIQALGGDYATNMRNDPGFAPEITGTIAMVTYDEPTGLSTLACTDPLFANRDLSMTFINPDTTQGKWFCIEGNSDYDIYIIRDIASIAGAATDDVFKIYDYHLAPASNLVDAGTNTFVMIEKDIDGDNRYIDGIPGGNFSVDVGADEFNPDSASGAYVAVVSPSGGELWMPGEVRNIEWTSDSVDAVDIFWCDNWSTDWEPVWQEIDTYISAAEETYEWTIPDEYSGRCKIKIQSTADSLIRGISNLFGIRGYVLTRTIAGNEFEAFEVAAGGNGWPFSNANATAMWPELWWSQFDYANADDPYTVQPYPSQFTDPNMGINAIPSDFPDWPLFVYTFGVDQCYFGAYGYYVYRADALLKWAACKKEWGGSCFGMATSSHMAFADTMAFKAAFPGISPVDYIDNLNYDHEVRRGINRLQHFQLDKGFYQLLLASAWKTPVELLSDCKEMLASPASLEHGRIVIIGDTNSVNNQGAHALTAYELERDADFDHIWYLNVYENNLPHNDQARIIIDSADNSWEYAPLGWSGNNSAFLCDPLVNYLTAPDLKSARNPSGTYDGKNSNNFRIFVRLADTILLTSSTGSIGRSGDSMFNTLSNGIPIIPVENGPAKPLGYFLPDEDWSCAFSGMTDSVFSMSIFTDSTVLYYNRLNVDSVEAEQFNYPGNDSALWVHNPDGSARLYNMRVISVMAEEEHMLGVENMNGYPGDSCFFGLMPQSGLLIGNYGQATTYDIVLRYAGNSGEANFAHETVVLPAHTSHQPVPNWDNLEDDSLKILIDTGNDGVVDDSFYVVNGLPSDANDEHGSVLPYKFELSQNYPNPFNPVTTIEYSMPRKSHITITVFNVLGQKIMDIVDEDKPAGAYRITWIGIDQNGSQVPTGMYLYRIQAGDFAETKKMLLLK